MRPNDLHYQYIYINICLVVPKNIILNPRIESSISFNEKKIQIVERSFIHMSTRTHTRENGHGWSFNRLFELHECCEQFYSNIIIIQYQMKLQASQRRVYMFTVHTQSICFQHLHRTYIHASISIIIPPHRFQQRLGYTLYQIPVYISFLYFRFLPLFANVHRFILACSLCVSLSLSFSELCCFVFKPNGSI